MSDESKLNDELSKLLFESNELLRSSYQIALRDGQYTNWAAYRSRLIDLLERQRKYLYERTGGTTTLAVDSALPVPCECICGKCFCSGSGLAEVSQPNH